MTCDCIERIVAELLKLKQTENPKVTEVKLMNITFALTGEVQTFTNSELKIIMGKKSKTAYINHDFCPFCGKPETEVK